MSYLLCNCVKKDIGLKQLFMEGRVYLGLEFHRDANIYCLKNRRASSRIGGRSRELRAHILNHNHRKSKLGVVWAYKTFQAHLCDLLSSGRLCLAISWNNITICGPSFQNLSLWGTFITQAIALCACLWLCEGEYRCPQYTWSSLLPVSEVQSVMSQLLDVCVWSRPVILCKCANPLNLFSIDPPPFFFDFTMHGGSIM